MTAPRNETEIRADLAEIREVSPVVITPIARIVRDVPELLDALAAALAAKEAAEAETRAMEIRWRAACELYTKRTAQVRAVEALPGRLAEISQWITGSYAPGMDPELVMRRRVGKIGNEYGELLDAIEGFTGENPRKGVYKTRDDVIDELLDCASASLAAVEHMTGDCGQSLTRLSSRTEMQGARLHAALAAAVPSEPTPEAKP